jgi:death-on-curing protein
MEEIVVLEKEHIYLIHEQVINEFGGDMGIYENTDGKIESILSQQYPSFGYDKYSSVYKKAAMLLYFFSKSHCFVDGNKRVALGAAYTFLSINAVELTMSNEEAEDMTMNIAKSKFRGIEIDNYISTISLKICYKSQDK